MTEIKVGFLTLISIIAIIIISFKVTSRRSAFEEYVNYTTILKDATGIFEKSPVKVAGINAGRIAKIQLFEDQALITFNVRNSIKVTKGSIIQLKTIGFLGDKYIDIILGVDSSDRLPKGSIIPSIQAKGIETITKSLGDILQDLKIIVNNIKVSTQPENAGDDPPIESIVSDLRYIISSVADELDPRDQASLLSQFKKSALIVENLKDLTEELELIVQRVRQGQGTLGKLVSDDEVIDQVNSTLSGINRIVNKVDSIRTEVHFFTKVKYSANNTSEFNLDMNPSPERYYRFGVVSSDFGIENKKRVTEVVDGSIEEVRETSEQKLGTYRFNAMIGRRVNNWNFQIGVLESSGAIGIGYNLSPYNLKFDLDLFDYRANIGPQLRLGMDIHLWSILYGKITGEDVLTDKGNRSLSIGLGISFADDDLKTLIGFFL